MCGLTALGHYLLSDPPLGSTSSPPITTALAGDGAAAGSTTSVPDPTAAAGEPISSSPPMASCGTAPTANSAVYYKPPLHALFPRAGGGTRRPPGGHDTESQKAPSTLAHRLSPRLWVRDGATILRRRHRPRRPLRPFCRHHPAPFSAVAKHFDEVTSGDSALLRAPVLAVNQSVRKCTSSLSSEFRPPPTWQKRLQTILPSGEWWSSVGCGVRGVGTLLPANRSLWSCPSRPRR